MTQLIFNTLGNALVKLNGVIEPLLAHAGMSQRALDWTMIGWSGIGLIAILALILAILAIFGWLTLNAYLGMTRAKKMGARKRYARIFTVNMILLAIEVITYLI